MPKFQESTLQTESLFSAERQDFYGSREIEGINVTLKTVDSSDLPTIRHLFMEPHASQFFEQGVTDAKEWEVGGKMYERFNNWVQRANSRELSWWIVRQKPTNAIVGAIGLKQDKPSKIIEVFPLSVFFVSG
jgi:hypothetical protein